MTKGSPVSPIVAIFSIEDFEAKVIRMPKNPRLWKRYVHNMVLIQKVAHKEKFLEHINSIGPAIQFTVEDT